MAETSSTRVFRLTHALPPHVTHEDEVLHLRAGWFTGCKPAAYFFFILGIVMAWTGITLLRDDGAQFFIFLGCVVLPTFGFAFWLAGYRTHWRLDRQVIQKKAGYRLTTRQEWPAQGIRGVEMVEQYHGGGRFSQLAPGVHLLMDHDGPINLGAHGNLETVREIGLVVAELYAVPFEDHTQNEDFHSFRRRKLIMLLVGLAIAAVIIIARELFPRG